MPITPSTEQENIINHDIQQHGRVLAGPGTGKSLVSIGLLKRISEEVPLANVQMVTFTRAATQELENKVEDEDLDITPPNTIHAFALSILSSNPEHSSLSYPVRIPDSHEQKEIRSDIARRLRNEGFEVDVRKVKGLEEEMASGWESLDPNHTLLRDENPELGNRYIAKWRQHRNIYGYTLLAELPFRAGEVLQDYEIDLDIDFLVVDEYQDLNRADIRLLEEVTNEGVKLLAIGDDDQSIYGFRMVAPQGIRDFTDQFDTDHDYTLSQCFRCADEVLEPATTLIETSPERERQQRLDSAVEEDGYYAYARFPSNVTEARGVADMVRARLDEGVEPRDIAILVRSQVDSWRNELAAEFEERNIDYGDSSVVNEAIADDNCRRMLAKLWIVTNREDSLAWWSLLKNTRGIAESFRDYIYDEASQVGESFGRVLLDRYPDYEEAPTTRSANRARDLVENICEEVDELEERVMEADIGEGGWGEWIVEELDVSELSDNARDLLVQVGEYLEEDCTLEEFIGNLEPVGKDLATEANAVRIMTMTKSKGLTVDSVFIMGAEEGKIPHSRADDPEEERRLLYVGMTRAERVCVLTCARRRTGPTARHGQSRVNRPIGRCPLFEGLQIGRPRRGGEVVEEVSNID